MIYTYRHNGCNLSWQSWECEWQIADLEIVLLERTAALSDDVWTLTLREDPVQHWAYIIVITEMITCDSQLRNDFIFNQT